MCVKKLTIFITLKCFDFFQRNVNVIKEKKYKINLKIIEQTHFLIIIKNTNVIFAYY